MITLRVIRHDRPEELLARCLSDVLPVRGEVLQLDTIDVEGEKVTPSTLWRVISVTVHVPSLHSATPAGGDPLAVRTVEVSVLPDIALVPDMAQAAEQVYSSSTL